MDCLDNFLKRHDMFGHPVGVNFKKQGDHHKTTLGGFVSVFVKMVLGVYVILMFRRLFTNGDDHFSTSEFKNENSSVEYKDTHFIMNPTLIRLLEDGEEEAINYFEDDEVKKHIEVRYAQRVKDNEALY